MTAIDWTCSAHTLVFCLGLYLLLPVFLCACRAQMLSGLKALLHLRGLSTSFLLSTGTTAGPGNQDSPRQQPAESPFRAANTFRSKSQGRRDRFIDDQASGERSSMLSPPAATNRPDKHLMHHTYQSAHPTGQTSTSSDSDSPPAAKRHRSRSLQRQPSRSNDTSDFSNADSPAKAPGQHHTASRDKQRQDKQKKSTSQQAHDSIGAGSLPRGSCSTGHGTAKAADKQQVKFNGGNDDAAQSKAAGLLLAGAAQTSAEGTSNMLDDAHSDGAESDDAESDDAESDPDAEGGGMPQEEEERSAFELPSQMPRELQSWAWDK